MNVWRRIAVASCLIAAASVHAAGQKEDMDPARAAALLPDLTIWGPSANAFIQTTTFSSGSCEVAEGCAQAGTRRLLRFTTETRNGGDSDLYLGNPVGNPLFEYAPCHGHYHFHDFARYELIDGSGQVVAPGLKAGFCLLDVKRWSASANPSAKYGCSNQGIQKGWADIYDSDVSCQYIDITCVPAGTYTLRMIINPLHRIAESNYDNDTTTVSVNITAAVPAAPTSLSASNATTSTINIVWNDNACTETGYKLDRKPAGGSYATVDTLPPNTNACTSPDLKDGTIYFFRVKSFNTAGNSSNSNESSDTTALGPPSILSATPISATRAQLDWTDGSASETGFKIERKAPAGQYMQIATTGANATAYTDTGLASGQEYMYRVRCYNSLGNSVYSNEAATGPLPVQLAEFTGEAGSGGEVMLRWATVSEVNSYGFTVERRRVPAAQFETVSDVIPAAGTSLERHEYSHRDVPPLAGTYGYRLRFVDLDGNADTSPEIMVLVESPLGVADDGGMPRRFALEQNHPNPFNPVTRIRYALPVEAFVSIRVYDVLGRAVAAPVGSVQPAGYHEASFDASQLPGGVYFSRMSAAGFTASRKMILAK